jgi:signal transduction histidine kinase
MLTPALEKDVAAVLAIDAVPHILEVVCRTTGMGFAAVARVTETHWVCCSVRDEIAFGLQPGGELEVATTLCDEIRGSGQAVVIEHVAHDADFCSHHTPAKYGFQSYISIPIRRGEGDVWGTLCAIDPRPAQLKTPAVVGMFELFAQLIAFHLDAQERMRASESALLDARQTSQLREEFIAVIGHDLRNPLQSLETGLEVMVRAPQRASSLLPVMQNSARRMSGLVSNLLDFARGRLGGGMALSQRRPQVLEAGLRHVVDELAAGWPGREIAYDAQLQAPVSCDASRIAQLLSNLLANALRYGDPEAPVRVRAHSSADFGLEIEVANAGPEIPADTLARLFEPYVRGRHVGQEGLGLGLYIVSEIARAHGGTMAVTSDDAETCFRFRLPPSAA